MARLSLGRSCPIFRECCAGENLVNPDDDSVWVSNQTTAGAATNFNRFGGNVNGGRPDEPERPPMGGIPKP